MKPFQGPRIKIERAKKHLQELEAEIDSFLARDAVSIVLEYADEYNFGCGPCVAYTYRQREEVPQEWGAIIGDVIHNMRVSLDLIASDVFLITGGKAEDIRHIHYPFCKKKDELGRQIRERRLGKVGPALIDVIEQTAPYPEGNKGLDAVHQLDIMDKHSSLVPVVSVGTVKWPVPVHDQADGFGTRLMKDKQRIILFQAGLVPATIGSKADAYFNFVFGEGSIFEGRDVVDQLGRCIASFEFILDLFINTVRRDSNLSKLIDVDRGS